MALTPASGGGGHPGLGRAWPPHLCVGVPWGPLSTVSGPLHVPLGRKFPFDFELNFVRLRVLKDLESVFVFNVIKEYSCTEQLVTWTDRVGLSLSSPPTPPHPVASVMGVARA